ncbi:hypothetical protein GF407_13070, partial [candidate division KSB1 bacterium]|nr:hypothetical protein [candidate division KSB1 bacterium]
MPEIRGRSGYPRPNLNRKGHQNGTMQNRTMNKNSRMMEGDWGGGDPPRALRALPLFYVQVPPRSE